MPSWAPDRRTPSVRNTWTAERGRHMPAMQAHPVRWGRPSSRSLSSKPPSPRRSPCRTPSRWQGDAGTRTESRNRARNRDRRLGNPTGSLDADRSSRGTPGPCRAWLADEPSSRSPIRRRRHESDRAPSWRPYRDPWDTQPAAGRRAGRSVAALPDGTRPAESLRKSAMDAAPALAANS